MTASASAGTTSNVLTNPGAESGLTGWSAGGSMNPFADNGTFNGGITPHSGGFAFVAGHPNGGGGSTCWLTQSVDLTVVDGLTTADIDAGSVTSTVSFWEQGLNQGSTSDDARIKLTFYDTDHGVLGFAATPEIDSHNSTWLLTTLDFPVPAGARSVDYTMEFVRHAGSDNDAYVDDNEFTFTIAPASCFGDLDGSGEVDGGDIGLVLLDFGPCPDCLTDLDGSGEVDGGDVGLILLNFGHCPG